MRGRGLSSARLFCQHKGRCALTLTFNPTTGDYIVFTGDTAKAQAVGLDRSKTAFGPNGEPCYFTKTPYAALPFYAEAEGRAKELLSPLYHDYKRSWGDVWDGREFKVRPGEKLMPFQSVGVQYGLSTQNVLIADSPGLGKTSQSIAICNEVGAMRVLVVVPASIRINWRREILKWSINPAAVIKILFKASDGLGDIGRTNFLVVSYELMRDPIVHSIIMRYRWDVMILDEAHYLKTHTSKRTQAIFGGSRTVPHLQHGMVEKVDKIIALTGTPLLNRPRECYTIANALCPDSIDYASYDDFCHRFNPSARFTKYSEAAEQWVTWDVEDRGRLPELQARLRSNFMVRRLKKDVMKDMPDRRWEFCHLEPTGAIKQALAHEALLHFTERDLVNPRPEIFGQISTIRREMGMAKIPRVLEHIKYLLDVVEIDKLVLFIHHREVMDIINAELADYGVVAVRGGMSSIAKDASVQSFIHNPKTRIFSGQLDAAGFGIDGIQHVAGHACFVEPAWTPGTNEQALDRLHRFGVKWPVLGQFLIVEGSIDERVLNAVLEKSATIHESLDNHITH